MRRCALAISNFEFVDMLVEMPLPRRFWSSHPTPESQLGFFEVEMQGTWRDVSERQEGSCKYWLDDEYLATFRMDFATFWFVYSLCEDRLKRQDTHHRYSINPEKRFAILLNWLAHSLTPQQLANKINIVLAV